MNTCSTDMRTTATQKKYCFFHVITLQSGGEIRLYGLVNINVHSLSHLWHHFDKIAPTTFTTEYDSYTFDWFLIKVTDKCSEGF